MQPSHLLFCSLCLSLLPQYLFAIETPDDSYFVCGEYLIAIETGWKQRMENKLEDDFALVRTDYTKLVEGEIADQLNPTTRGRAYPDRIDLETGVHSVLDRRTVVLERRERRDIDPTEWFTALSNTETIETHKMQPYPCKIVTKPKLQKMIEKHNNAFGSLKF